MSTLTVFARNIARQSFGKAVRLHGASAQVGALRFSSTYFTPGKFKEYCPCILHGGALLIKIAKW